MPSEPVILEEEAIQAGATLTYPGNLTLWNLADFILLPTLVYQMVYPRTRVIRWRWLLMCAPAPSIICIASGAFHGQCLRVCCKMAGPQHPDDGAWLPLK